MKKETKQNILIGVAVLGAFSLGWFWGDIFKDDSSIEKYQMEKLFSKDDKEQNIKKLEYVYNYVTENHIHKESIDMQQMWDNAIVGMLKDIDGGLTQYVPPIKQESVEQQVNGTYTGFGITLDKSSGGVAYIQNLDTNSSQSEGLANGDKIVAINDIDVSKSDISEISNIMNNENKVKITVQRGNETFEKEIEKEVVQVPDVTHYAKINENTHYIKIDSFNDKALQDFENIVNSNLKSETINDAIIIDLRQNYGGTLDSYEKIMSYFIKNNEILYYKKQKESLESIYSNKVNSLSFKKYIILVDNNTASAAELMAASFKELLNAQIVGSKTYGKGSIQSVINLNDNSYLYVTDKEYLTSKKNKIDGIGITPDFIINDYNEQYEKAILLSNNS